MVPIHDTDIASERWSKAEWEHYELWERIEVRLRRRKWLWIATTFLVFLILSSVPIVLDRAPKWRALMLGRKLAQQLNLMKRDASIEHSAFRLSFTHGLHFEVQKFPSCSAPASNGTLVHEGDLAEGKIAEDYALLTHAEGAALGVPGLITETCYDSLQGSDVTSRPSETGAFGILPVQDSNAAVKNLPGGVRLDRLTVVFLKGSSAEISVE